MFGASFGLGVVHAKEEILLFDSSISVDVSGRILVEETIRVRAEGNAIRRGIFRDIPRRIAEEDGTWRYVGFKLLAVQRDGNPEPYHTENFSDFVRIYLGDANIYLRRGEYTYTITYRTNRQLRFFDDFDELFWNVTGNFWAFPIQLAVARVTLPDGASILQRDAYTGYYGASGKAFEIVNVDQNTITFATTRPLASGEGLTVAVGWPKGIVAAPTKINKLLWRLWDNLGLIVLFIGAIAIAFFFFAIWHPGWPRPGKGHHHSLVFAARQSFTSSHKLYLLSRL